MSDPLDLTVQVQDYPADAQVIAIIIPIVPGTVDQAVAIIRGDVPSERNDLGKLSGAIDAIGDSAAQVARKYSRRSAIIFG